MALKYLLDTDTLSFVVSNRHPEVRKTFLEHSYESGISVITYAEALFGARKKNAVKLESLIGVFGDILQYVAADCGRNLVVAVARLRRCALVRGVEGLTLVIRSE